LPWNRVLFFSTFFSVLFVICITSAFGSVYRGKNKKTGVIAAIKKIELQEEEDAIDVLKEIEILDSCDFETIVKYYGTYKESMKCYWVFFLILNFYILIFLFLKIAMELCSGGSVLSTYEVFLYIYFSH
jgi:serine/threonine protein kinase